MPKNTRDVGEPIRALRVLGDEQPCSYLPGRKARHEYLLSPRLNSAGYFHLMNLNFRRSGGVIYRPVCDGCNECRQIRVPVDRFQPDRSQRRNLRSNRDIEIRIGLPTIRADRVELYRKYQSSRHHEKDDDTESSLSRFLYTSCIPSCEWRYFLHGRLVMISIADVSPRSLSAVYCYYDPAFSDRGLGTFNVLSNLAFARGEGIPHVYLGYHVRDCKKMSYKSRFRPCELLVGQRWVAGEKTVES